MELLYYDENIAVAEKPVGLDSQKDMPEAIRQLIGGEVYPVHRLDVNVGGLMVYARTKEAAADLSRQMQNGQFQKEYVALVRGTPPSEGRLTDLLFKDSRKNKVFVVKTKRAGVREAALRYRVLQAGEQSLVRVQLETGRSHQIRVQFASRGFPLVGDHKYGARDTAQAPMLYSCRLCFYSKGKREFERLPSWSESVSE